jgi:phage tail sheath protein FI
MGEYLRPDVYVEEKPSGASPIEAVGTSTGGFVGIAQRGRVGVATLVTSWTDYVNKFARGLKSPFSSDSYLAFAVYGFFQNGGGRAYVTRVAKNATKATAELGEGILVSALDEGTWANNNLEVKIVAGENGLDLQVLFEDEIVEIFENVTATPNEGNYISDIKSNFVTITVSSGTGSSGTELAVGSVTLSGGTDGSAVSDADYLGADGLKAFDVIDNINLIAIPGQTSKAVLQGLVDYCDSRNDCFAILDIPEGLDTAEALAARKELGGTNGACYYPWGKVIDPLGSDGKLRLVPPSGHVMGVYARTDRERGVHKAPAGVEATVRGFVEMERPLANSDVDLLNPAGVNCITARPNQGIVVWGARSLSSNPNKRYVSDVRLDINILVSSYLGTQWAVFEPNDEVLWGRISDQIKGFLFNKWQEGALFGATPEEAYFVKCDEELNTEEVRNSGRVIAEIGYAKKKPGEFVILRFSQKTATTN